MNQVVILYIQNEMSTFFSVNGDTKDKTVLWETFKAFIRGMCIGQKIHLRKKKTASSEKMAQGIITFEQEYRETGDLDIRHKLEYE